MLESGVLAESDSQGLLYPRDYASFMSLAQ
jgi:hypothetical protein